MKVNTIYVSTASLVVALLFMFTGCANEFKDQQTIRSENKSVSDSVKIAEDAELRATISRQTEALKAERDSVAIVQQGIAIGDLRFGMSEKEAWAAINKMREGDSMYKVGAYRYHVSPSFNSEGQLYYVTMRTTPVNASEIDEKVTPAIEDLITIIETKYGPAENRKWQLDLMKFKTSTVQIMGKWAVGTKRISVGSFKESSRSTYCAYVWIWDEPMQMLVENAQLKQEAGAQLEAAEKF